MGAGYADRVLAGVSEQVAQRSRFRAEPIPGPSTEAIRRAVETTACTFSSGSQSAHFSNAIFNSTALIGPETS
jgi:hypothetical protein